MKKNNVQHTIHRLLIWLLLATFMMVYFKFCHPTQRSIQEIFIPPTPREAFLKQAKKSKQYPTSQVLNWDTIYQKVVQDTLRIPLPHQELVVLDTSLEHSAQVWRLSLPGGRRLSIQATKATGGQVFGELFRVQTLSSMPEKRPLMTWDSSQYQMTYENKRANNEDLLFLLQVVPDTTISLVLTFISEPILTFPVADATMRDIGSLWGAPRDGGRRIHEGNDIFAPRGTPLIAVTNGRVVSTKDGKLGGKTVWLRDGEGRSLTYYYAHLDSQLVETGQYVERGDTVGTVGNTGNARTTPPHLHFGIYRRGAIDPYPFIKVKDELKRSPGFAIEVPGATKLVPKRGAHFLRYTPQRKQGEIRQLAAGEEVTLLGVTKRYYRVKTAFGELGYVNFD